MSLKNGWNPTLTQRVPMTWISEVLTKRMNITKSNNMIISSVKKANKVGVTKGTTTLTQRMVAEVGADRLTKGAKATQKVARVTKGLATARVVQCASIAENQVT